MSDESTVDMPPQYLLARPDLDAATHRLPITAWTCQGIVLETLKNYMLANPPQDCGFAFSQRYHTDPSESKILLDVGYHWKTQLAKMTPATYINRGEVRIGQLTLTGETHVNPKESSVQRNVTNTMSVTLSCIAPGIGFAEQYAEYNKQAIMSFSREIKKELGLRQFRLIGMSKPTIYLDTKDTFVIELTIEISFDEGWIVQREDPKLKTVGLVIFDAVTKQKY
jgi:hypothetical protein